MRKRDFAFGPDVTYSFLPINRENKSKQKLNQGKYERSRKGEGYREDKRHYRIRD
jgi:hypothetical protein